jgi:hypothetical protein
MNTSILKKSKWALLGVITLTVIGLSSCADPYYPSNGYGQRHYKNMPPGQAKKYYGSQSARDYAPGQTKKRYRY